MYLMEVGQNGRLDLIKTIAQPDMIDEANRAFWTRWARFKTFRSQIGQLFDFKSLIPRQHANVFRKYLVSND